MVILVRLIIFLIWVIDEVTNFDFKKTAIRFGKIFTYFFSAGFLVFLIYNYSTGFLYKVLSGVVPSETHSIVAMKQSPSVNQFPKKINKVESPVISAKSVMAIDKKNNTVLYEQDSNERFAPASTAKLMTALVALDIYGLDDVLEVPKICTEFDSTKAWLPDGKKFTVRELIYSMLIGSAGDSACVLSMGKVPYENFVSLMNRKAQLFGLNDTHFANPIGLDDANGQNYSTANDLYSLASYAMKQSAISDAVKTKSYDLKSTDGEFYNNILTTNQLLLEIPNTLGIKTGTTESAGEVFIYDYADADKDLVIVVMGSQDRFSDTKNILSWIQKSYSWEK
jgi:serine-type D-Ala-D-Ala carboxypeptidase (penicillin-binding protein 5/6)